MQVALVKIGDFRQITRYNSETSTVSSIVNLVRSQVSHTERPHFVCSTFAVMQCITQDHQQQLILVKYTCI